MWLLWNLFFYGAVQKKFFDTLEILAIFLFVSCHILVVCESMVVDIYSEI